MDKLMKKELFRYEQISLEPAICPLDRLGFPKICPWLLSLKDSIDEYIHFKQIIRC